MHRKDFIVITFDGRGGYNPVNAGGQDNRGLELDLRFDLKKTLPGLSGYMALGATETEYTDYLYDTQDYSTGAAQNVQYNFTGKEAVGVPFHTASVGADYTYAPFGVTVGGWYNWQDEYYFTPDNAYRADAVGVVNARLAWRPLAGRNLEVSLVGKNLMDKSYYGIIRNLSPNGWNEAYPAAPFSFTAIVRAGF
jgi:outer membrane receptor for ferric coprogen and ferric-rhodotorulic acid